STAILFPISTPPVIHSNSSILHIDYFIPITVSPTKKLTKIKATLLPKLKKNLS
ncbi:MAG: hypothetical protein PWQ23_1643, partial [Thermoanaerobacter sp.]|nr:hypothetical protein [Thermoanaerobacter sp.]